MKEKRNSEEIETEILRVCTAPEMISQIELKTRMNPHRLNLKVQKLIEEGKLRKVDSGGIPVYFCTTPKGKEELEMPTLALFV